MPQTSPSGSHNVPSDRDLAYAVLVLERQLDAYQRLHEEDIASLRDALQQIRALLIDQVETAAAIAQPPDNSSQTHQRSS